MGNLFLLLSGWQLAGVVAIVAVPATLLALCVCLALDLDLDNVVRAGNCRLGVAGAGCRIPLDGQLVWQHRLGSAEQFLRTRSADPSGAGISTLPCPGQTSPDPGRGGSSIARTAAGEAASGFIQRPTGVPGRNVHLIVLESFWDPMALSKAGFSADPLDPAFRRLWAETGNSQVLSPVFGGYTANAEFETLCGFPVTEDAVFLRDGCGATCLGLPRHLKPLVTTASPLIPISPLSEPGECISSYRFRQLLVD